MRIIDEISMVVVGWSCKSVTLSSTSDYGKTVNFSVLIILMDKRVLESCNILQ